MVFWGAVQIEAWQIISRYKKVEAVNCLVSGGVLSAIQRGAFLQNSILAFQFDKNRLDDHKEASETRINPYPIYAAADKTKLNQKGENFPGKIWAPSLSVS